MVSRYLYKRRSAATTIFNCRLHQGSFLKKQQERKNTQEGEKMNPHAPSSSVIVRMKKMIEQMVPIQIIAGLANDQTFFSKNPIEFQKKVKRVAHDMPRGHFNVWFFKTPLPFQIEFSRQKPGSIMRCCSGPTMVSQCSRTSKKVVIGLRTLRVVQKSTQYLMI